MNDSRGSSEATGDARVADLIEELDGFSGPPEGQRRAPAPTVPGPLRMRGPDGEELAFISMFAGFDTPFEVTASELAIELLFPADLATAEALAH